MIAFVTTNEGKFREARELLAAAGIALQRRDLRYPELQADTLEEVVRAGAEWVAGRVERPFALDDSGLFVEALRGYPGVYSSYAYRTVGCGGLLRLLAEEGNRRARFVSLVAFLGEDGLHLFRGECEGTIITEERGHGGFGFDPVFVPEGDTRTFAEMATEEKNRSSHRGRAFRALADFLAGKV